MNRDFRASHETAQSSRYPVMSDEYDEDDPIWHAKGKVEDDEAVLEHLCTDVNLNTPNDPVPPQFRVGGGIVGSVLARC